MDTIGWTVLVIGIIVILIVIGLIIAARRKRQQQDREHATELRAQSQESALDARQREAEAASQQVEAEKTQIDAERLQREAQEMRVRADDHLREADEMDPDSTGEDRDHRNDAVGPVDAAGKPTQGADSQAVVAEAPTPGNTRHFHDSDDPAIDPDNPRSDDDR